MSHNRGMLTLPELAERLRAANVEQVAKAADVSTKTIYRIRSDPEYRPNLRTMEALEAAVTAQAVTAEAGSAA